MINFHFGRRNNCEGIRAGLARFTDYEAFQLAALWGDVTPAQCIAKDAAPNR